MLYYKSSRIATEYTEKTHIHGEKKFAGVPYCETPYQNLKNSAEISAFTVYNFVRECYNERAGKA